MDIKQGEMNVSVSNYFYSLQAIRSQTCRIATARQYLAEGRAKCVIVVGD
jgi:hypothetical protein